jgi:hypothetical protein
MIKHVIHNPVKPVFFFNYMREYLHYFQKKYSHNPSKNKDINNFHLVIFNKVYYYMIRVLLKA